MRIKALESKNIEGVMYQEGLEYEIEKEIDLKYEEVKAPEKESTKKKGDK
jgi:hypothetical protein